MTVRLRLVTPRLGSISPAFLLSAVIHVALALLFIIGPMLQGGSTFPLDSIPVELVGGLPGEVRSAAITPPAEVLPEPAQAEAKAPVEEVSEPEPQPIEEDTVLQEETPLRRLDKPDPIPKRTATPPIAEPGTAATPPVTDAAAAERAAAGGNGGSGGTSGYSIASEGLEASELTWYRDRVVAALRSHWRQPLLEGYGETLQVSVRFEILRDGTIAAMRIDASSGVPSLDRSALRAVTDASPLPPLPKQILRSTQPATFVFRWDP